jgi:type I restriction enzyme S subunit
MAVEWLETQLQAIAAEGDRAFAMGPFGSNIKAENYRESGVPVIRGTNLGECREAPFIPYDFVFLSEDRADQLASSTASPNDIVFVAQGTVGKVGIIPTNTPYRRFILSQNLMKVTVNHKLADPRFVFYFYRSNLGQHEIMSRVNPTGVPCISKPLTSLRQFGIQLPSDVKEQRAIAHILGTLDDKIELNRRMNETLEAMAQAIFKSWFVDFDPVRAKAEGRDPGLPEHIADLFPDSFEDSEMGEIPKGWSEGTLGEFSSLNPETWSKETRPTVINYVDLSNTKWGRIESVTVYKQEDAPSRAQRVLRPRDTIVGTVRPGNGSYAFISEDGLTGSTGFAVLRPLRAEYAEFVYFAATTGENIEALSHLADGGAYPAVRPEVVAATQVVRPSGDVLMRFSRVTGPLLVKMAGNEREYRTLAALRDALLPKLISGEIRVKDAERSIATEETKTVSQETSAIYTIGHSNHSIQNFINLLKKHCITAVADVRSSPVSQHYPQFNQGVLSAALKKENISYVFMGKELGGRPDDPRCYENGQVNYLRMAETQIFKDGIDRLLKGKDQHRIVLLCAEKEPLDCHRTLLVSRNLYKLGIPIKHILADGSIEEHQDTERRLVKVTGLEPNLFDRSSSDSERIQQAYYKRAREIAYKPSHKEDEYEYAE